MSLKALLMMQRRKAQGKAGMATGFFKKRREVIGGTDSASEVSSRKIMSIAGIITAKNVKVMRKIFKNNDNKLDVVQFVEAMQSSLDKSVLHTDDVEFAMEMVELYKQIDINGDGLLEWSEFTSFIVGVGKTLNMRHDGIMKRKSKYVTAHATVGPTITSSFVKKLFVLGRPAYAIGVIYENSHDLKLFTMPIRPDQHNLKCEKTLRHHEQFSPHEVLYAICIPEFDIVATCSVDEIKQTGTYITFWGYEGKNKRIPPKILARIRTSFALDRICWCGALNTLYASVSVHSGYIYGWHVKPIMVPKLNGNFDFGVNVSKRCTMHWHSEGVTDMFPITGNVDTMLVSASKDGTLCMWNTRTNVPFYSIVAHDTGVKRAVYFERCDMVITIAYGSISYPRTMIPLVFDSANDFEKVGELAHETYGHEYPLLDVGVQTGLKLEDPHIVTVDERGNVRTWNAITLNLLQAFSSHDKLFPANALPHTKLLNASACLIFEDVEALKKEAEAGADHDKQIEADLRTTVVRGLYIPHAVPAIIVATDQICAFEMRPVHAKHDSLIKAVYNSQSCTFFTCSVSCVQVWDAFTGVVIRQYESSFLLGDRKSEITSFILDDRERKFIIGDTQGRVLVFNCLNGAFMKELTPHSKAVSELCYCHEDKVLLSLAWDGKVLFSTEAENDGYSESLRKSVLLRDVAIEPNRRKGEGNVDLSCIAYSHHFNAVITTARVSVTNGNDARVLNSWDFEYAKLISSYSAYGLPSEFEGQDSDESYDITAISFLGAYPAFIACDTVGTMCLYSVPLTSHHVGKCLAVLRRSTATSFMEQGSLGVMCVCAVPVGKKDDGEQKGGVIVYAGEENGRICIWHLTDEYLGSLGICQKPTTRKKSYSAARSMKDQRYHFQNLVPAEKTPFPEMSALLPVRTFSAHRAPISSVQYMPNSNALLVASLDGTCTLWSKDGVVRLGNLDTDANKPKPSWRLNIDLTERKKNERKAAIDVLVQIGPSRRGKSFLGKDSLEHFHTNHHFQSSGSRRSPFRIKPIYSPKASIGQMLLQNVAKRGRARVTDFLEDSDAESVHENSGLDRPHSSKLDEAMAVALSNQMNSWRDTISTRQKRMVKTPNFHSSPRRGRTAASRRHFNPFGSDRMDDIPRGTTAPAYFDNRSARSTGAMSDFMETLWQDPEDTINPMPASEVDSKEMTRQLGKYEREIAEHATEMMEQDRMLRREEHEGISAKIQRMKKEASKNSYSRLGRLSHQLV
jgi:WD40 repeat protein